MPGFYPTLGSLVDANGKPISDDDGLTRLLTDIRFGVRDKIPRILQEAGKNNDFMLRRAHDIVVPLEFPKEGRKLEYSVGFLE